MRRLTAATTVSLVAPVLVAAAGMPAAAQPTSEPAPSGSPAGETIEVPEPVPGEEQCQVDDYRLTGLSGMVARDDGYIVVNSATTIAEELPIFFLDQSCAIVDQQGFYPGRPRDPEDLALDRDEDVLWVADIGDDGADDAEVSARPTVALWRVDLAGGDRTPVIHRFTYPDGEPRNAEALLLDGDGTPLLVTKEVGTAEIFRPTDLVANNPAANAVALEQVGEFTPPDTGSAHPRLPSQVARQVVTGAAHHPAGDRVVLRTYTDAFEFEVSDGDVVGAITDGEPVVTPLPEEPQGEAISYTPEGERFVTVSEVPEDQEMTPSILGYTPADPPEPEPPPEGDSAASSGGGSGSLFSSVQDILNLVAVVGVLGVALTVGGIVGIVRARRRFAAARAQRGDADGQGDRARERSADAARADGRARASGTVPVGATAGRGAASAAGYDDAAEGPPERDARPAADERRGSAGVYTSSRSRGAPEQDAYHGDWPGDQYGDPHGGHPPERGGVYPAGGPGQPGGAYAGGAYAGGTYTGGTYAAQGYAAEGYAAEGYGGGAYRGGESAAGAHPGGYPDGTYVAGGHAAGTYAGGTYTAGADPYAGQDPYAGRGGHPAPEPYPGYGGYAGYGGYGDQAHAAYGGEAQPGGYPQPGYPQDYAGHQGYQQGHHQQGYGGQYGHAAGHAGHQEYAGAYADDYYDDPDYRYEFRDR